MWAARRAGEKEDWARGWRHDAELGDGGAQESLCNRSFLLFPGVAAAKGESSLGEVNLDSRWMGGVDGATRTGREGSTARWYRRIGTAGREQGTTRSPGNGKGRWVGARVCLNRDLRNLSLEFPVKD